MTMRRIMALLLLCSIFGCSSLRKSSVDEWTVEGFELDRYLGKWYEIARFDNRFERGLSHVTAQYTMRKDGKVRVENSGRKANGDLNTSIGKARLLCTDQSPQRGELEVAFFLNFYAPYNILMLDEGYNYALVSSGDDFLWILSRTPQLDSLTLNSIITEAKERGFNTSKLLFVEQD